jgi:hypothetical protein
MLLSAVVFHVFNEEIEHAFFTVEFLTVGLAWAVVCM